MATRTQREFARMAQARETLGIRSEHRIQQEILRTQAAYQRLASSGTMTWREQQRAAEQMRQTVGRLNAEMGVYSGKQRLVAGAQKAGLMAAGVMAGAAVVAPKVNRAFSYDEQLAHMANTAYGDPSLGAEEDRKRRFAGRQEMDRTIREAIRYGGGQGKRLCNAELVAFVGALQRRGFHDHLSRGSTRRYSEPSVGRRLCTDRIRCQREHGDQAARYGKSVRCCDVRRSKRCFRDPGSGGLSSQPVCISSEHWLVRSHRGGQARCLEPGNKADRRDLCGGCNEYREPPYKDGRAGHPKPLCKAGH